MATVGIRTTEGNTGDIIKCPICLDIYKIPKCLPCHHTFCEQCLQSYIDSSVKQTRNTEEFKCPVCRVVVPASNPLHCPAEWAEQFPSNHSIMTIIDKENMQTKTITCDPCQMDNNDVTALSWCKVCNEALCETCRRCHRNMKATKQHKLSMLSEMDVAALNTKRVGQCRIHNDEILMAFCLDHDKACCTTCVATSHMKCNQVITLHDAAKGIKEEPLLQGLSELLSSAEEVVSGMLTKSKTNADDLDVQKLQMVEEVVNFRKTINTHLDELEEKMKQDIENLYQQHVTEIKNEIFGLESRNTRILNFRKVLDTCLHTASDVHVFLETRRLSSKTNDLTKGLKECLPKIQRIDFHLNLEFEILKYILSLTHLGRIGAEKSKVELSSFISSHSQPPGNTATCDDSDVIIVREERATEEQIQKARKFMLPDNFYLRDSLADTEYGEIAVGEPISSPQSEYTDLDEESISDDNSGDEEPPFKKKKIEPPSNDELTEDLKKILGDSDLQAVTMKTVIKQVYKKYPGFDLSDRKEFLKRTVKRLIS